MSRNPDSEISHKTVIADLGAARRDKLTRKLDRPGIYRLLVHGGLILFFGVYIAQRLPGWIALLPLQGILITFLFTIVHETIHRTAFLNRRLNDWVANCCGLLVFLPANWFRLFHFAHHRHTHDPLHDPELATPKPSSVVDHLVYLTGIPEWLARFKVIVCNAFIENTDGFVPSGNRAQVKLEARLYLFIYVVLLIGSIAMFTTTLFWIWVLPSLLGNPFLRLYLLTEHTGCPHTENMLENTRTMFAHPLIRFFTWNMPYHAEHHIFPGVPFHRLPDLHQHLKDHLQYTANSYLKVNREYLSLLGIGKRSVE